MKDIQKICDLFNEKNPVGKEIIIYVPDLLTWQTKTTSKAYELAGFPIVDILDCPFTYMNVKYVYPVTCSNCINARVEFGCAMYCALDKCRGNDNSCTEFKLNLLKTNNSNQSNNEVQR